ncbi:MAG: hypothetical protein HY078_03135 [Elusimicrobia bacterium]|nr:hypothetical protein [Elusimicrobiota bacterium]
MNIQIAAALLLVFGGVGARAGEPTAEQHRERAEHCKGLQDEGRAIPEWCHRYLGDRDGGYADDGGSVGGGSAPSGPGGSGGQQGKGGGGEQDKGGGSKASVGAGVKSTEALASSLKAVPSNLDRFDGAAKHRGSGAVSDLLGRPLLAMAPPATRGFQPPSGSAGPLSEIATRPVASTPRMPIDALPGRLPLRGGAPPSNLDSVSPISRQDAADGADIEGFKTAAPMSPAAGGFSSPVPSAAEPEGGAAMESAEAGEGQQEQPTDEELEAEQQRLLQSMDDRLASAMTAFQRTDGPETSERGVRIGVSGRTRGDVLAYFTEPGFKALKSVPNVRLGSSRGAAPSLVRRAAWSILVEAVRSALRFAGYTATLMSAALPMGEWTMLAAGQGDLCG